MHVWKDGISSDRNAKDCEEKIKKVDRESEIEVKMVKGGGWAAKITKYIKD